MRINVEMKENIMNFAIDNMKNEDFNEIIRMYE